MSMIWILQSCHYDSFMHDRFEQRSTAFFNVVVVPSKTDGLHKFLTCKIQDENIFRDGFETVFPNTYELLFLQDLDWTIIAISKWKKVEVN